MNLQFSTAMMETTVDVFHSMFGWDVKICEVYTGSDAEEMEELSACISFTGDLSGTTVLNCNKKTAETIASELLGEDVSGKSEDVQDSLGEMLNIIIGAVKSSYPSEKDPYRISLPTIIAGKNHAIHVKAKEEDNIFLTKFSLNEDNEYINLMVALKS